MPNMNKEIVELFQQCFESIDECQAQLGTIEYAPLMNDIARMIDRLVARVSTTEINVLWDVSSHLAGTRQYELAQAVDAVRAALEAQGAEPVAILCREVYANHPEMNTDWHDHQPLVPGSAKHQVRAQSTSKWELLPVFANAPAQAALAGWEPILEAIKRELPREHRNGDAPGHAHSVPGIWDSDNGELAGKECAWCLVWNQAKAMLSAAPAPAEKPANCRNRLRAEGKPYPKSGCAVCKTGGLTGCPYEQEGKANVES